MVLDQVARMGLTAEEAAARLVAEGPNELPTDAPRRLWQQAWSVLREPMLLLLVAAGTINFLLAELLDGVILMLVRRHRDRHLDLPGAQDRERPLSPCATCRRPRALVIRDGQQVRIAGQGGRARRHRLAVRGRPRPRRRDHGRHRALVRRRVRPHRGVGAGPEVATATDGRRRDGPAGRRCDALGLLRDPRRQGPWHRGRASGRARQTELGQIGNGAPVDRDREARRCSARSPASCR